MNYSNLITATDSFIKKIISLAFIVLSSLIILTTLAADNFTDYRFPNSVHYPNFLYYVAAFSLIYIYIYKAKRKPDVNDYQISPLFFGILILCIGILVAVFQKQFALWVPMMPGGDFVSVREMAEHLSAGGKFYNSKHYSYFQRNVNNVNITIIFSWILSIVGNFRRVIYIGALLTNISTIFSSLTIYRMTGSKKISIIFLVAGEILFAVTWRSFIPYTDNFGMFFVAAILFLYTSRIKAEIKYPLILIATACGILVKVTTLIAFLGICIHFILNKKWRDIDKSSLSRCSAITALTCGVLFSVFLFIKPAVYHYYGYEVDDSKKVGITFFLMLGQNTKNYGAIGSGNPAFKNIKNYSDRSNAWFKEALHRIKERGFIGNMDFYLEKIGIAYFDGLFHNVSASKLGTSFFGRLYSKDGNLFFLGANITQLIWNAFILMWLFSGILTKEKNTGFLWNIILGITLYLLLFENRAKYLYMFAPIFTILAGVGFSSLYSENKSADYYFSINNKAVLKCGTIILLCTLVICRMNLHTVRIQKSEKTKYVQSLTDQKTKTEKALKELEALKKQNKKLAAQISSMQNPNLRILGDQ